MSSAAADNGIHEDEVDIKAIRQELGLSQAELARLIGLSARAVQSCEQGWRNPSVVEKLALLLLMAHRHGGAMPDTCCWEIMDCPPERRAACITYLSQQGHLCWFLNGTPCTGRSGNDWGAKRPLCLKCEVFRRLIGEPAQGKK